MQKSPTTALIETVNALPVPTGIARRLVYVGNKNTITVDMVLNSELDRKDRFAAAAEFMESVYDLGGTENTKFRVWSSARALNSLKPSFKHSRVACV